MSARRTNEELFTLGQWAGMVESQLDAAEHTVPVMTLQAFLGQCKANRDFTALEALRGHWAAAAHAAEEIAVMELEAGDSRDGK